MMPAANAAAPLEVWHYPLDVAVGASTTERELDADELRTAAQFRFDLHRRRYIASHIAVRRILAAYVACDPAEIVFRAGANGKPFVAGPDAACTLSFNASHSHDYGAVAVATTGAVGFDVEVIRPLAEHAAIAGTHFSARERSWLEQRCESERLGAFYALWTCKEAYLKATGVGLAFALDQFSIDLDDPAVPRLQFSARDCADCDRWHLRGVFLGDGIAACVAADRQPSVVRCRPFIMH